MGLVSNIKKVTGMVKSKATSSLGMLKAIAVKSPLAPIAKGAAKVGLGTAKVGFGVAKVAAKVAIGSKIGLAVGGGLLAVKAVKAITGRKQPAAIQVTQQKVVKSSPIKTAAKIAAGVAAGAGALYVAEQLAEKAGVRGGAGFIGARPKKAAKRRAKKRYVPRRAGKRRRRMSALQRYYFGKRRRGRGQRTRLFYRRKIRRRGRGVSKTELRHIRAVIRRAERD